jgi:hypothetical protein
MFFKSEVRKENLKAELESQYLFHSTEKEDFIPAGFQVRLYLQ